MPNALFQFYKGDKEVTVPMDKDTFLIGRDLQSDIRLLEDTKVSRKHCSIKKEKGEFYITDLQSSNGTLVNDVLIESKQKLHEHDKIKVGAREFIFLLDRRQGMKTQQIAKIVFCSVCGGSVTHREIKEGMAKEGDEGFICAECSESDTMTKQIFMNYEILGKIAQGGMGVVYKAKHRIIGNTVAIKLIREGKDTDQNLVKRFMREVRLGSMVRHPNIIEFMDAGEHEGVKYMIMEFCEGESLEKKLKGGKTVGIDAFPDMAFQVLDAVAAVHDADLVHRDIKPDNILLTPENIIKLIDFGLVKSLDPESQSILTQTGAIMGSPHYMPPEQIQDSKTPDIRGDIYSLGATFYRLLCGEPPVKGKTPVEFIKNLTARSITHPSQKKKEVSKEIGDWIMGALALDPDERYEDIWVFINGLEDICRAEEED